jgi:hypothetical protein
MDRFLAVVVLSGVAIAHLSFADVNPKQNTVTPSVSNTESVPSGLSALPPMPRGKSTVIGGAIRDVDPVRDQITLKVFGGRPMKILFDERTQLYHDGTRTPLRDLRPVGHASVETVLDGTNIFARSIHILSRSPEGECQGQVLNYNPGTRELTVNSALSHEPIELRVPVGTPVVRVDEAASTATDLDSDLVKGTLVSVKFESNNEGRGVAQQISILATPGAEFVFSGNVSYLDLHLHSEQLVLVDPRDGKSYKIYFEPARFPISHDLHEGVYVMVTVHFDGARYVASAIKVR